MIRAISEWVRDLAVMALLLAFAEMLLPRNDLRKFARVVIGLVLVAIILGSLVDLASVEDALATTEAPLQPAGRGPGSPASGYAEAGRRIARAGLDVAGADVTERLERQVESLARLSSGADVAEARVALGPSGELSSVRVVVQAPGAVGSGGTSGKARGGDPRQDQVRGQHPGEDEKASRVDDMGAAELAARVERAIRDFYGLAGDTPITVEVRDRV